MTVNEQIVTGRKFRKLVDEATKLWQRISFWTKASDVEFDDGSTAETKMGAINGITDSLVSTSSNIAASAKALSQLNNNLMSRPDWIIDPETGKITGYKTPGGADTVFPFNGESLASQLNGMSIYYDHTEVTETIPLYAYNSSTGKYDIEKVTSGANDAFFTTSASISSKVDKVGRLLDLRTNPIDVYPIKNGKQALLISIQHTKVSCTSTANVNGSRSGSQNANELLNVNGSIIYPKGGYPNLSQTSATKANWGGINIVEAKNSENPKKKACECVGSNQKIIYSCRNQASASGHNNDSDRSIEASYSCTYSGKMTLTYWVEK